MIQDGSKVSMHYTLRVDGQVVDTSAGKEPLEYEHGTGQIIAGLETALVGLGPGDRKEVTVAPEQGYGVVNPEAVQQVPISAFQDASGLQAGVMISGQTPEGRPFQAVVNEVKDDVVTLDLNHPLAGKTLHFEVEIVSVGGIILGA